jgi:cellulose synthase/poly-beta-1,6-N-acetylglucosamine synthase-like glycosyltransferase
VPYPAEVVVVPASGPRTKPKACNVGLALARGELVTIYDVEDRPESLQLRRAVVAFGRLGPGVACLQAELSYYNTAQNLLTRWFTAEYLMWFSGLLPGLVHSRAPIPLGGTSTHIRTDVLRRSGAWDPHNVTEDADLGIRLHRLGHQVALLDSITYEEANSDVVNWVKQRSRWHKGYLQSWLVHIRRPRQLVRELGLSGFLGFNLFVAGTPVVSLLNPVFWGLTIFWFAGHPASVARLFPAAVYYPALVAFGIGNFAAIYSEVVRIRAADRPELLGPVLLSPLYWALMAFASVKAVLQLFIVPSFWEKTTHGLDRPALEVSVAAA